MMNTTQEAIERRQLSVEVLHSERRDMRRRVAYGTKHMRIAQVDERIREIGKTRDTRKSGRSYKSSQQCVPM